VRRFSRCEQGDPAQAHVHVQIQVQAVKGWIHIPAQVQVQTETRSLRRWAEPLDAPDGFRSDRLDIRPERVLPRGARREGAAVARRR
jgi:hypothetical protein